MSCLLSTAALAGCGVRPGDAVRRHGDEIVAAGQMFRIGTPVVLWMDPGGYDAYRVERRFAERSEHKWVASAELLDTPNRYGLRGGRQMDAQRFERLRGGGWDLKSLQEIVDQFVIHYDVCGTSRRCFRVLHDKRCLSVHFMLDLDGTIYQTLDLKERAWHATTSNDRSVGIEIANIGAYPVNESSTLDVWYGRDEQGRTRVTLPEGFEDGHQRTENFVARPLRDDPVVGVINGRRLKQYDLTAEQYEALIKLTAALSRIFPKIKLDCPRDAEGQPIAETLDDQQLANLQGVIGHYHITRRKIDPGPAFQWERVLDGARRELRLFP